MIMIYTKVFFNLSKTGNFLYKVTYMNYKYENTSVTSIPRAREGGRGGGKEREGKKREGVLGPTS